MTFRDFPLPSLTKLRNLQIHLKTVIPQSLLFCCLHELQFPGRPSQASCFDRRPQLEDFNQLGTVNPKPLNPKPRMLRLEIFLLQDLLKLAEIRASVSLSGLPFRPSPSGLWL